MEKLRAWLALTEKTPSELAEEMNVTRQTVHNWLSGNAWPNGQTLRRLHERTGIPLDDLVPRSVA